MIFLMLIIMFYLYFYQAKQAMCPVWIPSDTPQRIDVHKITIFVKQYGSSDG